MDRPGFPLEIFCCFSPRQRLFCCRKASVPGHTPGTVAGEVQHSNEAFKKLARKYGKQAGLSDEQRVNDYDDVVLEVAEEKPEFANTKTLK